MCWLVLSQNITGCLADLEVAHLQEVCSSFDSSILVGQWRTGGKVGSFLEIHEFTGKLLLCWSSVISRVLHLVGSLLRKHKDRTSQAHCFSMKILGVQVLRPKHAANTNSSTRCMDLCCTCLHIIPAFSHLAACACPPRGGQDPEPPCAVPGPFPALATHGGSQCSGPGCALGVQLHQLLPN